MTIDCDGDRRVACRTVIFGSLTLHHELTLRVDSAQPDGVPGEAVNRIEHLPGA
jgi:hypothetical protein